MVIRRPLGVSTKDIAMTIDDKSLAALDAHFKQWQQIAERVRAQVTPALKVQDTLQKSLGPIIEAQKTFQKAIEPILTAQNRWRELPPRTQEALLLLGAYGWYWDLEIPYQWLWELKKALSDGNVAEAEEALVGHFEGRLEEIEKSITERFPRRAPLIRAAFNAHQRQEYALSIPVLLAQTDGICKEVVNQYLFIKQNKKPRTAIYVDQITANPYMTALLSPLAQTLPINASERERPAGFDAFNRHTVLHGESLDYGSKTNSLKAISLVNYVAHVLEVEKENP